MKIINYLKGLTKSFTGHHDSRRQELITNLRERHHQRLHRAGRSALRVKSLCETTQRLASLMQRGAEASAAAICQH